MPFLVAVPFLVLAVVVVSLSTAALQRQVSEGFIAFLRQSVRGAAVIIGPSAELAVRLTQWVTHKIGAAFHDAERLAVGWFGGLSTWAKVVIEAALGWPIELARLTFWLLDVEIPRLIRALPTAATKVLHVTTTRVVRIERTITKLPKMSAKQARSLIAAAVAAYVLPYLAPLKWLRAHFHALTAVLPHTIPLSLGRTITGIRKRLRRLERITAAGVGVGAVALALSRLGLSWVRCRKVGKVGKRLCGMDDSLLDSLLLDALVGIGAASVVEFAEGLRAIEDEAVAVLRGMIREWPA